jgi:hypothetical protein
MHLIVTRRAQCDQILFFICAAVTPELQMMHLQVLRAAAELTSPSVALQDLMV